MNFVTEKELTVALDSLNEWMAENPDLKIDSFRFEKSVMKRSHTSG